MSTQKQKTCSANTLYVKKKKRNQKNRATIQTVWGGGNHKQAFISKNKDAP